MEDVKLARAQLNGDDAGADAIDNNHIHDLEFVEEADLILDALLIERLQDHVPGAIGGVAGTPAPILRRNCAYGRRSAAD